jgi:hypothetical protein
VKEFVEGCYKGVHAGGGSGGGGGAGVWAVG